MLVDKPRAPRVDHGAWMLLAVPKHPTRATVPPRRRRVPLAHGGYRPSPPSAPSFHTAAAARPAHRVRDPFRPKWLGTTQWRQTVVLVDALERRPSAAPNSRVLCCRL